MSGHLVKRSLGALSNALSQRIPAVTVTVLGAGRLSSSLSSSGRKSFSQIPVGQRTFPLTPSNCTSSTPKSFSMSSPLAGSTPPSSSLEQLRRARQQPGPTADGANTKDDSETSTSAEQGPLQQREAQEGQLSATAVPNSSPRVDLEQPEDDEGRRLGGKAGDNLLREDAHNVLERLKKTEEEIALLMKKTEEENVSLRQEADANRQEADANLLTHAAVVFRTLSDHYCSQLARPSPSPKTAHRQGSRALHSSSPLERGDSDPLDRTRAQILHRHLKVGFSKEEVLAHITGLFITTTSGNFSAHRVRVDQVLYTFDAAFRNGNFFQGDAHRYYLYLCAKEALGVDFMATPVPSKANKWGLTAAQLDRVIVGNEKSSRSIEKQVRSWKRKLERGGGLKG